MGPGGTVCAFCTRRYYCLHRTCTLTAQTVTVRFMLQTCRINCLCAIKLCYLLGPRVPRPEEDGRRMGLRVQLPRSCVATLSSLSFLYRATADNSFGPIQKCGILTKKKQEPKFVAVLSCLPSPDHLRLQLHLPVPHLLSQRLRFLNPYS